LILTEPQGTPAILVAIDLAPRSLARLRGQFTVHQALTHAGRMALAAEHGGAIRAMVTNGTTIIPAELIAALPHLGIICAQGVGHEGIDLATARARGIVITNGAGTNAPSVADHTIGLMLAIMRDIRNNDALVRGGGWRQGDTMRPIPTGKRVGILGLGDIGRRIARRCEAFDMIVGYHNRNPMPEVGWSYLPSTLALAEWADILIIVLPGGASTRHLVGKAELEALGPQGFLVNVGRGSVVDTGALVTALQEGRLAGAALDVFDGEPVVPEAVRALPNVLLTPHMAGRSPESLAATIELVIKNLSAHFAGQPVLTPIPI
jgi:D-3-phosphoglycerate dehydrogenase